MKKKVKCINKNIDVSFKDIFIKKISFVYLNAQQGQPRNGLVQANGDFVDMKY